MLSFPSEVRVDCSMYGTQIKNWVLHKFPAVKATDEERFEAISASVFGTKQRRNGPMPAPEVQVNIRRILREQNPVNFFVPWGARKQTDGQGIDILELCALKQLMQMRDELQAHGKDVRFHIRLEDLSDSWLFQDEEQVNAYCVNFISLIEALGLDENVTVKLESGVTTKAELHGIAAKMMPVFIDFLRGKEGVEAIRRIGWRGDLPDEQREYYTRAYRAFYPDRDPIEEMARYFSSTLARVQLGATCVPTGEYIHIYFGNSIPGYPLGGNRIYYRSIPERNTHIHRAPWLGKGYLVIDDDDEAQPRSAGPGENLLFVSNKMTIGDARLECDYVLA